MTSETIEASYRGSSKPSATTPNRHPLYPKDVPMPLTVTFDTNTLASVVSPESGQRETGVSEAAVRAAIEAGRIHGFFSETLVTLEGVEKKDRADVLGKTRLVSGSSSSGKNQITLTVGFRHFRNELNTRFSERVRSAIALGMRGLRAPARFGSYHAKEEICPLFMPPGGLPELFRCMVPPRRQHPAFIDEIAAFIRVHANELSSDDVTFWPQTFTSPMMRSFLRTLYLRKGPYAEWYSNLAAGYVARPNQTIAAIVAEKSSKNFCPADELWLAIQCGTRISEAMLDIMDVEDFGSVPSLEPYTFSRVFVLAYTGAYEWQRGARWRRLTGENSQGQGPSFDELRGALNGRPLLCKALENVGIGGIATFSWYVCSSERRCSSSRHSCSVPYRGTSRPPPDCTRAS